MEVFPFEHAEKGVPGVEYLRGSGRGMLDGNRKRTFLGKFADWKMSQNALERL